MPRTVLVHLNIEVPDAYGDLDADVIAAEVLGALEVGTDEEQTPALFVADVVVALAEEA
jgi:hypothetical protein